MTAALSGAFGEEAKEPKDASSDEEPAGGSSSKGYKSHSLNSLKGGYIGDYYRGF